MTETTEVEKRTTINLSHKATMEALALRRLKELETKHAVSLSGTVMAAIEEKYTREIKRAEEVCVTAYVEEAAAE